MDGKFTDEEFKKASVAKKVAMLYGALKYEKDYLRKSLSGLKNDHATAAKARKTLHDKMDKISNDMAFLKGSNAVILLVIVALIGTAIYFGR